MKSSKSCLKTLCVECSVGNHALKKVEPQLEPSLDDLMSNPSWGDGYTEVELHYVLGKNNYFYEFQMVWNDFLKCNVTYSTIWLVSSSFAREAFFELERVSHLRGHSQILSRLERWVEVREIVSFRIERKGEGRGGGKRSWTPHIFTSVA